MADRQSQRRLPAWMLAGLACTWGCSFTSDEPVPVRVPEIVEVLPRPEITELRVLPEAPLPGSFVRAHVAAHDPGGTSLSIDYRWRINGEDVSTRQPVLHVPETAIRARIELQVTARNGYGNAVSQAARANVRNRAPTIDQVSLAPAPDLRRGDALTATPSGSDPDNDPIDFDYTWFLNDRPLAHDELSINGAALRRGDRIRIELRANDGHDVSEKLTSVTVEVQNTPPKIVSAPDGFGGGGSIRYRIRARDKDGDRRLRYRLLKGPQGMSVEFVRGVLKWTPGPEQRGEHAIIVQVDDQHGGVAEQLFLLDVATVATMPHVDTVAARIRR